MTQAASGVITVATSGPKTPAALMSDLNDILNELNTSHKGAARPTSAAAGTLWLDDTPTPPTFKVYTGSVDKDLFSVDFSTGVLTLASQVVFTGSGASIQTTAAKIGTAASAATITNIMTTGFTYDFGSIAAGSSADSSGITVSGAQAGDVVLVAWPSAGFTDGVYITGRVSGSNTVTLHAVNFTAGAVNPASITGRVWVLSIQ